MPKIVCLVEFPELLSHAQTLGYEWNATIATLSGIYPEAECNSHEFHFSEFEKPKSEDNPYGWSEDVCKIMSSFFKLHQVNQITVIND